MYSRRSKVISAAFFAFAVFGAPLDNAYSGDSLSFFDVFVGDLDLMPFPPTAGPVSVHIVNFGSEGLRNDADLDFYALGLLPSDVTPIPGVMRGSDNGGSGPNSYGVSSFFDIFTEASINQHTSLLPRFRMVFRLPGSTDLGTLVVRHPENYPFDTAFFDIVNDPSHAFADVDFDVDFPTGRQSIHIHAGTPQGRAFVDFYFFEMPVIGLSDFDIVMGCLIRDPTSTADPIMRLTVTGTFVDTVVSVEGRTWTGVKQLYGR
jgi:hypothetical protein